VETAFKLIRPKQICDEANSKAAESFNSFNSMASFGDKGESAL